MYLKRRFHVYKGDAVEECEAFLPEHDKQSDLLCSQAQQ